MPEPIPTQAEIDRVTQHLLRYACAQLGHAPYHQGPSSLADSIAPYYSCECGEITWKPVSTDA